ncbi:MAG: hypothetical protein ACRDB0_05035 [Paraclostridium sp.]
MEMFGFWIITLAINILVGAITIFPYGDIKEYALQVIGFQTFISLIFIGAYFMTQGN